LSEKAQKIADHIVQLISSKVTSGVEVSADVPFSAYGMSSADVIGLAGELEEWLAKKLSPTLLYEFPTAAMLARHLAGEGEAMVAEAAAAALWGTDKDCHEPVAIVGMSCRLPGAPSKEEFWALLEAGRDAIGPIPASRFDAASYYDPAPRTPGKMYVREGGFIGDIDMFDAPFFSITRAEAAAMDPQQRLLLTCTQEAFDDAGELNETLAGSRTCVAVGLCNTDYASLQLHDTTTVASAFVATGGSPAIASNRISY
jgi:acyl carrier protein